MKKIFVYCLLAILSANCLVGCKCKSEKPKEPPMVVESPKPLPLPVIMSVVEKEGTWTINLNKSAVQAIKKGARVRLIIGYCYYESDTLKGNTIQIKPDWHPPLNENRVSAGLWMPKGESGYYLSSVLIQPKPKTVDGIKPSEPEPKPEPKLEPQVDEVKPESLPEKEEIQPETETPASKEADVGRAADSLSEVW